MSDVPVGDRPVLAVIGPHSGCGKSTFVLQLLRHLPGVGCLKISPVHDARAPWPAGGAADFAFEAVDSLTCGDRDTGRYLSAGAAHVERLRHRGAGLRAGLAAACGRFPPGMPVIVESSSALVFLRPRCVLLVVRPPLREMKPATLAVLPRVTDLLWNMSSTGSDARHATEELRREFSALNPTGIWRADLLSEPLPAGLLERVRSALT
ncbi:MAG TPA: hypothetical protein PKK06_10785 [Phycisphaerae bacterium]|nr:hypothetical protein [Phycisphaerae bacterium]HNU44946.1 hypothetical protein [Phycisphaerae bacterium]